MPSHVSLERQGKGDLVVRWIERTRDHFEWKETIDGPQGSYVVELKPLASGLLPYRSNPVAGDAVTIPRQVIEDAMGGENLTAEVVV
ncbi:hypothetical protein, partial [Thermaurantiacus sp.]